MKKDAISELELLNRAEQELDWFEANFDRLIEKYDGKFVAISGGGIIASSGTIDGLIAALKKAGVDPASVITQYVTKTIMIF